ncbi:phosphoribosylamine--glycine ligase [Bacteroidales bacterium OttesenSCG-928-B11]|nr:phosphoribosylamine--glycine ligase [Bacteroidales bacterium OttesenSCG-928-E04]MDL2312601.1 phosphoribosylamine--glycine ligase [Bacteroidales bacterium OttesenSCG-928-B11]
MNILVVGRGGREHAIAWKLAQSPLATRIYVAPGSDAMNLSHYTITSLAIDENDNEQLIKFALTYNIRLVVIGPETALLNGLADDFAANGIRVFGPSKAAALIEGSKQFAKELMLKHKIPTAEYSIFDDYDNALAYVKQKGAPIVIKYDGLAAGKGVVVAKNLEEAGQALAEMLRDKKFGNGKVVIEEFLEGPEFSLMALVNGEIVAPLAIAQDHKRAYNDDLGPNTGGMGAYTPVPTISAETVQIAVDTIMKPTVKALSNEKRPFTGILYGGLMLTADGPKVIEFNARFGDPETEVVLPRMKSDLLKHILDILNDIEPQIEWHDDFFLGVVLASAGYPESSTKGAEIRGLEKVENLIFHMGTKMEEEKWVTNGGRVLFVVGRGKTLETAQLNAYSAVDQIDCDKLFFRSDIGNQ